MNNLKRIVFDSQSKQVAAVPLAALLRKNVDDSAHQAATSPINLKPLPTKDQKSAGNYPKGHHRIAGHDISIENPIGSVRDARWPAMTAHYGYIKGTEGNDGDHLDVFVKSGTPDDWAGDFYVIDQSNPDGTFDEHKVMLGYGSEAEARRAYLNHYSRGWAKNIMSISTMTQSEFKDWMDGDLSKPAKAKKVYLARTLLKAKARKLKSPPRDMIAPQKKKLAATLAAYFAAQSAKIIPKVVAAYKEAYGAKKSILHSMLRKSDPTPEELVQMVRLQGWDSLVDTVITPEIEAAFNTAGMSALNETGVEIVDTNTSLVNDRAAAYAEEAAGELVTNIDESTRDMIASTVKQAINEGWDSQELADALEESRAFSPERADLIASYELGSALEAGNLQGWQASGVVTGKQWLTADDELVSDDCQANADQGVIPLDAEFQSGDDAPLAHPNCRCVCVGITESGNEGDEIDDEAQ